jgi:serine/threonine protein kinase
LIGQTLSYFKITAKLGEGGMGEVWQAEDTKLGREVAIKIPPEAFVADPERLARSPYRGLALTFYGHEPVSEERLVMNWSDQLILLQAFRCALGSQHLEGYRVLLLGKHPSHCAVLEGGTHDSSPRRPGSCRHPVSACRRPRQRP